ncbi:MAG: hypothetical protein HZC48_07880 [Nitrospirae bacterium]|nr:hypothetical protein [Nitrospirota bacterium]
MKKYLALVVFMVLTLVFALAGVQDASADVTLGNVFQTSGDFITLVTVVNKSTAADPCIHWMYRYDDPSTAAKECFHVDAAVPTTPNDMFTVDISNTVNGGNPIPGALDTTSDSFNIGAGYQGFFTLYNFSAANSGDCGFDYDNGFDIELPENTLKTETVVANLSTGLVLSVKAPNDPVGTDEGNIDDMGYGASPFFILGSDVPPTAIWHPTAAVATSWWVNVLTTDTAFDNIGNPAAADTLSVEIAFANSNGISGTWYDINENPKSTDSTPVVDCFDELVISDFVDPAGLPFTVLGGWATIQMVTPGPGDVDKGILVSKIESTNALTGALNTAWTSQNRVDW